MTVISMFDCDDGIARIRQSLSRIDRLMSDLTNQVPPPPTEGELAIEESTKRNAERKKREEKARLARNKALLMAYRIKS